MDGGKEERQGGFQEQDVVIEEGGWKNIEGGGEGVCKLTVKPNRNEQPLLVL